MIQIAAKGSPCPLWVCAVTRRRFPVGASPSRQPLQPEATGAGMEVTKCLKPTRGGHWKRFSIVANGEAAGARPLHGQKPIATQRSHSFVLAGSVIADY